MLSIKETISLLQSEMEQRHALDKKLLEQRSRILRSKCINQGQDEVTIPFLKYNPDASGNNDYSWECQECGADFKRRHP